MQGSIVIYGNDIGKQELRCAYVAILKLCNGALLQAEAGSLAAEREGVAADRHALDEDIRAKEGDIAERQMRLAATETALLEQRRGMTAAIDQAPPTTRPPSG
jgi:hypothetical protein